MGVGAWCVCVWVYTCVYMGRQTSSRRHCSDPASARHSPMEGLKTDGLTTGQWSQSGDLSREQQQQMYIVDIILAQHVLKL